MASPKRIAFLFSRLCIVVAVVCVWGSRDDASNPPLNISAVGTSNIQVSTGHTLTLQCQLNKPASLLSTYNLQWVHITNLSSPDDEGEEEETILTEEGRVVAEDENYSATIESDVASTTMTLSLKEVRHKDDGKYECRATPLSADSTETATSAQFMLTVNCDVQQVQIQFDTEPLRTGESSPLVHREPGQYRVICTASGFNPAAEVDVILWTGEEGDHSVVQERKLFDPVASAKAGARRWMMRYIALVDVEEDDKRLSCTARAKFNGSISKVASIPLSVVSHIKLEAPRPVRDDCCLGDDKNALVTGLGLSAEPRKVVTIKRASLSLDCGVVGDRNFGNLTYVWNKDGSQIISRSERGRRFIYPNGTLHIRRIVHRVKDGLEKTDEGLYECFATNNIGTVLAQRIQVVVASLEKEFLAEPEGDQQISVGENVFLPCRILATPQDLHTVWQRDGSVLKLDTKFCPEI